MGKSIHEARKNWFASTDFDDADDGRMASLRQYERSQGSWKIKAPGSGLRRNGHDFASLGQCDGSCVRDASGSSDWCDRCWVE